MRTKYSRRTFLGWMAAAPLLAADNSYTGPIALQLYTLRNVIGTDVEGTLRKVAEIGYQEVEWAGFYNKTAKEIRSLLESVGLKGPSAHFNVFDARNRWNERMDFAREAGVRYMVIAAINHDERKTLDDYKRAAELFNKTGELSQKHELQFAYHNHDFEFKTIDGKVAYNELLRLTDPKLVALEMDVYWITRAGKDPFDYFHRYPGRFQLLHLKDKKKDSNEFLEVGQGDIDWPGIFRSAKDAGVRHFIVEQDQSERGPLESIAMSCKYLRGLKY